MIYTQKYQNKFSARREEHAFQHELSRQLLSLAVRHEYSADFSTLKLLYTPGGKPYFSDFPAHFSISHCRGLVCCALSEFDIGIDCERIRPFDARLARRICTEPELEYVSTAQHSDEALTTLWTLKESMMKLSGKGMAYGFKNAEFAFKSNSVASSSDEIFAASYTAVSGYIISVCTVGALPTLPVQTDFLNLF